VVLQQDADVPLFQIARGVLVFGQAHEKFLSGALSRHDHGMATSLDVTTASNNLLQVQTNYVTALYEVLTAKTELEQLLNKF